MSRDRKRDGEERSFPAKGMYVTGANNNPNDYYLTSNDPVDPELLTEKKRSVTGKFYYQAQLISDMSEVLIAGKAVKSNFIPVESSTKGKAAKGAGKVISETANAIGSIIPGAGIIGSIGSFICSAIATYDGIKQKAVVSRLANLADSETQMNDISKEIAYYLIEKGGRHGSENAKEDSRKIIKAVMDGNLEVSIFDNRDDKIEKLVHAIDSSIEVDGSYKSRGR